MDDFDSCWNIKFNGHFDVCVYQTLWVWGTTLVCQLPLVS